jgi:hypothetical protein
MVIRFPSPFKMMMVGAAIGSVIGTCWGIHKGAREYLLIRDQHILNVSAEAFVHGAFGCWMGGACGLFYPLGIPIGVAMGGLVVLKKMKCNNE